MNTFTSQHEFYSICFDEDSIIRFSLTVRKNYRSVPYHNWAHAFSVAHAMYTVVKTANTQFKPVEVRAATTV